jgi:tetratricopeptide (TPR) repeat protein
MSRTVGSTAENRRIDSWKEIAAFFGRDERTVKRWEKERGLPVHRVPGQRGGVFAYADELTVWLNSSDAATEKREPEAEPAQPSSALVSASEDESPPTPSPSHVSSAAPISISFRSRTTIFWSALLIVAALASGAFYSLRRFAREKESVAGRRTALRHTPDPQAEELYLKGRYYWGRRTEGSLNQALDAFTQAVVHDSEDAKAYAGLAECYDLMPEFTSMPGSEAFPRAMAAAGKAISLDDSLAEAHRALAFALFYWEWKVPGALGEYQRALQLDPRDEEAHHWYATSLMMLGRYTEAMSEIDKARQLNPGSRSILSDQALIRFWAGDRAAAVEKLREIERAESDFLSAPRYLAELDFAEGDYRGFVDQSKRLAVMSKDAQLMTIANAAQRGLAGGGEQGMLEAMRVAQQRYFDRGQSSGFQLARTCALLGRKQEAITYLKAAIASHDYMVLNISSDPTFALLNGDPDFDDLQRQIVARMYRA